MQTIITLFCGQGKGHRKPCRSVFKVKVEKEEWHKSSWCVTEGDSLGKPVGGQDWFTGSEENQEV